MLSLHHSSLSAEHFLPFVFHILRGSLDGKPATSVSDEAAVKRKIPCERSCTCPPCFCQHSFRAFGLRLQQGETFLSLHIYCFSADSTVSLKCIFLKHSSKSTLLALLSLLGDTNHHLISGDNLYWPLRQNWETPSWEDVYKWCQSERNTIIFCLWEMNSE